MKKFLILLMIIFSTTNNAFHAIEGRKQKFPMMSSFLLPTTENCNLLLRGGAVLEKGTKSKHIDNPDSSAENALKKLELIRNSGREPDIDDYNEALKDCWKGGRWDLSLDLYTTIRKEGLLPNRITFNAVLGACARGGQNEHAEKVFSEMKSKNIEPDEITYNAMIISIARQGKWRKGLEYFHMMRRSGLAPNTLTYNSLISACAAASEISAALQLYEAMIKAGVKPNSASCNGVLGAMCGGERWREVLDLRDRMAADGVTPDRTTFNAVLVAQGSLASEDPSMAEAADRTFADMTRCGLPPDRLSYLALTTAFAKAGYYHRAAQVLEAGRAAGVAGLDTDSEWTGAAREALRQETRGAAAAGGEEGEGWGRQCAHVDEEGSVKLL